MKNRITMIVGSLILGAMVFALAACQQPAEKSISPTFGDAVRHNMAVQIINPSAGLTPATPTDLDGRRAAGAIARYGEGKEVAPVIIETTNDDN